MSYAIYGESDSYVHLVAGETFHSTVVQFIEDVDSVGVLLKDVFNIFAVHDRQEDVALENYIRELIAESKLDNIEKEVE